ncbi:hypothetical protein LTR95_012737 [Oleoguttula sp. CCFEE 5521]
MASRDDDCMFDGEDEWEGPAGFDDYWERDFSSDDEPQSDANAAGKAQQSESEANDTDSVFEDDWSSEGTEAFDHHEGSTVGDDRPVSFDWQTEDEQEAWKRAYDAAFPVIERMSTLELEDAYKRRLPDSRINVDSFKRLNELTGPKYGVWPRSRLPDRRSRSLFEPRAKYALPHKLPHSARVFPGRPEWVSLPDREEYRYGDMERDFVVDRRRASSIDPDTKTREELLQYLIEEAEKASALLAIAINEADQQEKAGWWDSMLGSKAALLDNKRSTKLEDLQSEVKDARDRVDEVYAARETRRKERLEAEREEDKRYEMNGGVGEISEDDEEHLSQSRGLKRPRRSAESPEGRPSKRPRLTITALPRSSMRGVRRSRTERNGSIPHWIRRPCSHTCTHTPRFPSKINVFDTIPAILLAPLSPLAIIAQRSHISLGYFTLSRERERFSSALAASTIAQEPWGAILSACKVPLGLRLVTSLCNQTCMPPSRSACAK